LVKIQRVPLKLRQRLTAAASVRNFFQKYF
jgi:hypothetical protein